MTTQTDPNRVLTDEVAALRRELAETRRDMAHLIAAVARQDDNLKGFRTDLDSTVTRLEGTQSYLFRVAGTSEEMLKKAFQALGEIETTAEDRNHTLLKMAERVDLAQEAMRLILEDIKHLRHTVDQYVTNLDERSATLGMWIDHLASRVWPNADAFHDEIACMFPQGFSAVPYHRLTQKQSDR